MVDGWGISCEIVLILLSLDFIDDQSTLVQVMVWCRQATSHYLSQCWPRSLSPHGVTRPQCVNMYMSKINQEWSAKLIPVDYQHIAEAAQWRLDYVEKTNPVQNLRQCQNVTRIRELPVFHVTTMGDKLFNCHYITQNMHKVIFCFVLLCCFLFCFDIFSSLWIYLSTFSSIWYDSPLPVIYPCGT